MIKQILLIDDDEVFTQVLSKSLTRKGLNCSVAHTHDSACHLLKETVSAGQACDAAVLDLRLGNESGLTLIAPLLAIQPSLKILVLTGYASIATAVEAVKLGANNYLPKPADANAILQALEQTQANEHAMVEVQPLSIDRLEWEHIQKVLTENNGNVSATARSLGMHRRTLQRKLQKRPKSQ